MELLKRFAEEKKARGFVKIPPSDIVRRPTTPIIKSYNISDVHEFSNSRNSPLNKSTKWNSPADRKNSEESPQRKSGSLLPDKFASSQLKLKYYSSPTSKFTYITRPCLKVYTHEPTIKNRDLGPGSYSHHSAFLTESLHHEFSKSPRFSRGIRNNLNCTLYFSC